MRSLCCFFKIYRAITFCVIILVICMSTGANTIYNGNVPQLAIKGNASQGSNNKFTPWLRKRHVIYFNGKKGTVFKIPVKLKIVRSINYIVTSPSGNTVNGIARTKRPVKFRTNENGTYKLKIIPGNGAFKLKLPFPFVIPNKCHLLASEAKLYFLTARDNDVFKLFVVGGGKKELAKVTVFDSTGKEIFKRELRVGKSSLAIELPIVDKERNKIWKVVIGRPSFGIFDDVVINFPGQMAAINSNVILTEDTAILQKIQKQCNEKIEMIVSHIFAFKPKNSAQIKWRKVLLERSEIIKKRLKHSLNFEKLQTTKNEINALDMAVNALLKYKFEFPKLVSIQVPAISNKRIMPDSIFPDGEISSTLKASGAGDEYVPISFVLQSLATFNNVKIECSKLRDASGKNYISNIRCRVVKVWFQDKGDFVAKTPADIYNPIELTGNKILVPELLLSDDSLVKINKKKQINLIKVKINNTVKYVSASSRSGISGNNMKNFFIRDSKKIQAFKLVAEENKQFYILIKIPSNTKAGVYTGNVSIFLDSSLSCQMKLVLKVLPFNLPEPYLVSSIYYYKPNKRYYGKNAPLQYRKEWKNMREHGIYNVMYPFNLKNEPEYFIPELLKQEAGKPFFYRGEKFGNPQTIEQLNSVRLRVKEIVKQLSKYGIKDIFFYGIDEARGEKLLSQISAWKAIKSAGGKIFVSGFKADTRGKGNFALVGDLQDAIICWAYPNRKEAAKWHSKKHMILSYGNPQGGVEAPDTYRRNYGLLLWQQDYDGAMTYLYHWGDGQRFVKLKFPSVWNDFCRAGRDNYKQHNMVYPTSDGVIDTLQWEGYREAVTDIRYLTYLKKLMEKSDKSSPAFKQAKHFLKWLKKTEVNVNALNLDGIRKKMVSHILALIAESK
jgi:hypothetical protein